MKFRAAARQQLEGVAQKWKALGKRWRTRLRTDSTLLGISLGVMALDDSLRELINVHRAILREIHPTKSLGLTLQSTPGKEGDEMALAPVSLDLQHDAVFTAAPSDASGAPIADPALSWHSGNEAVATVEVSADGLTCKAVTKAAGTAQIFATDGVLSESCDLTVAAGPSVAALNVSVQVVPKA